MSRLPCRSHTVVPERVAMCVQKACESRAAGLAALDDARSPRVRNSSTNHASRGSRAGHLGVGETRSRFSEREEGGGTQVRFVTLERSRWRVVLRLSVPAGMDARDRRASVDRANARGKRSTADTTRSFGARRARRRIRRHRTPRVARAGDGRRAVFSDTLFVGCFSRSGTRSRALRGARSRPARFVSASSSASDPFIAFVRVPRRRRLRKSVRRTSARARLPTPRRPR